MWPDETTAARYGFRHALYQELWYEQGTINQRKEWHQRIGLRKELAYNGRVQEIAAELAIHENRTWMPRPVGGEEKSSRRRRASVRRPAWQASGRVMRSTRPSII